MIINQNQLRKVIPIASGKGGVGKSILSANLGIMLAAYGRRTVLIDLDLGGSNLHTYLGLKNRQSGIGNYVSDKSLDFNSLLSDTPYTNLKFVAGDVLVSGTANLMHSQRKGLISRIEKIDADFVILDLGSGTGLNVIDFFLIANAGIIVSTPQTPAILNAYNFLKNAVFRQLQRSLNSPKKVVNYLKDVVKDKKPGATPTISQILDKIEGISAKAGAEARAQVDGLLPHLVLNMGESPEDLEIGYSLRDLVGRNLGVSIGCLGFVYQDKAVAAALKGLKPVVVDREDSLVSREIDRIAQKILQSPQYPVMPLDLQEYEDSFGLATIEARNDFTEVDGMEDARQRAGVSPEDFLAIIAAQKKKIEELQGTVRMLTMGQGPR
ncbi:MAG: P-loop NTPase [Spirochaetes bacterium]|jgi:flagellar biosynthesis protein FlhG|nr:P-loop NTPase [Spirochaetota bacterium]